MGRVARLSLVAVLLLAFPAPAAAHDHGPPMALLRVNGFLQRGRVVNVDWVTRKDGRCVEKHRRQDLRFGPPVRVDIGAYPGRLRLLTSRRPRLKLLTWVLRDGSKKPLGPAEEIPFELEPLARNGRTLAWDAVFRLAVVQHRFIAAYARWPDREGCDEMQRATWTYHIRGL